MVRTIELFSGTKSFSKIAKEYCYSTCTVDNQIELCPDLILDLLIDKIPLNKWDILWASPPCTTFSVASIGCHWKGGKQVASYPINKKLISCNNQIFININIARLV